MNILLVMLVAIAAANDCHDHCVDCDASGEICFACEGHYEINVFGMCVGSKVPRCTVYGPSSECFNCQPTYILNDNSCRKDYSGCILANSNDGTCFDCGFGTVLDDNHCVGVINCAQLEGQLCLSCKEGYQLQNNVCVDVSEGCEQVGTDGLCRECKEDYVVSGYRCIPKEVQVPRCYIYDEEAVCLFCKGGFVIHEGECLTREEKSEKEKNLPNCQVPDIATPGVCLICKYGYYPDMGKCAKVSPFCADHNVQTGACFDCKYGLHLQNGSCIDLNCNIQSGESKSCVACHDGYSLNSDGVCQYTDENCVDIFGSRCEQCKGGFYVDQSGRCQRLPSFCAFANFQTGQCLECISGYIVNRVGECEQEIVIQHCQVVDPFNNSQCLVCAYGWYPGNTTCLQVSELCRQHNVQTGKCTSCANVGHQLEEGICVDPNCERMKGKVCLQCDDFYLFNTERELCTFHDPHCLELGNDACELCQVGFYLTLSLTCSRLPSNCIQAAPTGICLQCMPSYSLNRNAMCQFQPQPSPQPEQSNTQTNEDTEGGEEKTESTESGQNGNKSTDPHCKYASVNGICIECSQNYYISEKDNRCVPVNPLCKEHDNRGLCTSCYRGYTLVEGRCQLGVSSDPYCKTFANGYCTECYPQYYYHSYDRACKRVNALCKTHNQKGQCTSCYQGYQLNLDSGNCDVFFRDPNCIEYDQNICTQCAEKHYLSISSKCLPVSPLCKSYDDSNGFCTECYQGWNLQGSTCVVGAPKDPNCLKYSNGVCTECYDRYYVVDGECEAVSSYCQTYSKETGLCKSCYRGYTLRSGECKVGQVRDPNCKNFALQNTSVCEECYEGYLPIGGECSVKNPICRQVDPDNGDCTECWQGYTLQAGVCVLQQETQRQEIQQRAPESDPYCLAAGYIKCEECLDGFFIGEDGVCEQVDPYCKTYQMSNGWCLTCYSGYVLKEEGKCVVGNVISIPYCLAVAYYGCMECIDGYYPKNGQCSVVSILCSTYNRQNGQCLTCITNYILQEGECIYPSILDENCAYYVNSYCSQCKPGYTLHNYTCK